MALLKVTDQMIEASKRPSEGWYRMQIQNPVDKLSKPKEGKKQTLNCFGDLVFVQDLQTGKDMTELGKARKDQYLFNYEYATMESDFICAALDIPSLDAIANQEIDITKALTNRYLHARVYHYVYENKEQWGINAWLPDGKVPF